MVEFTIIGRKSANEEKIVITVCHSQHYADFWVDIAKSEGFIDVEILKEDLL